MGTCNSKHAEVMDTGVVNSNFIVEDEGINMPSDMKIIMYIKTLRISNGWTQSEINMQKNPVK